jgi:hypothetical protein
MGGIMATAWLKFDTIEQREEYEDAVNGWRYSLALWNIKNEVRSVWKHQEMSEESYEIVDKIYEMIHEQIAESGARDI